MSGALVKLTAPDAQPKLDLKKSRRGFGLFSDEEAEESASERRPREPVRFSGDMSGFGVSDSEGQSRERSRSPTKTSSRTSTLTTPSRSRKSNVASRRSTPYNSTTSRALQRAKRGAAIEYSENEEERLISESIFDDTPAKKTRFAAHSEDDQDLSTEVDTDQERGRGRGKGGKLIKHTLREHSRSNQHSSAKNVVRKTWGEWLKSFIPALTGPDPEPERAEMLAIEYPQIPDTPDHEYSLSIPGSYERHPAPSPKGDQYINPNVTNVDFQRTPVRTINGLFAYGQSPDFNLSSPASSHQSQSPASPVKKGSRAPTAPTSARRMLPTPPAPSYRKPSHFIERMRNAKTKKRYDPYSRPSASPRKGMPLVQQGVEDNLKDLSPEDQLELLERREKDRKVQEAEDRYLRRETLRRLGRPVEDEDMSDTPTDTPTKIKTKEASVEGMDEDNEFPPSSTPPDSPPQKSAQLFKNTGAPLFQFQNTAPKLSFAATSDKPEKSTFFNPTPSFGGETDGDKENVQNPPPPPVMSHRELPSPPIPAPAPPAINGGLFGAEKQPIGGFGITDAPAQSYQPVSPVPRQRFDKFRPRVSSGLRETATIEKENDHDKENATDSGSNSEGASAKFAAAKATVSPSSGALREMGQNVPTGAGIKIDVRGKLAAVSFPQMGGAENVKLTRILQLPVGELSQLVAWPSVQIVMAGDAAMQQAVRSAWSAQVGWMGEWADDVFGAAREKVTRI